MEIVRAMDTTAYILSDGAAPSASSNCDFTSKINADIVEASALVESQFEVTLADMEDPLDVVLRNLLNTVKAQKENFETEVRHAY